MASAVTFERFRAACERIAEDIRAHLVPNPATRYKTSTGNLAFNAFKWWWEGTTFHIEIDEDIAPYMVYTNEPWLAKRWNKRKNPNEGWWEYIYDYFAQRLADELGGEID